MNNNKFIDEFLHQDQDHPATFDGNENLLNFDSQTTTTTTTTNLAAKNMIDVDDLMNENDMVLPDTHAEHHQHQEGFDNEFGQGAFKQIMKVLAGACGTNKISETVEASQGMEVQVVVAVKPDKKDPTTMRMNVRKVIL